MSARAPGGARAGPEPPSAQPAAGTRLGGRYRLWERLSERGGSAEWRATDEVLARPVAVRTFTPGSRARQAAAAARAASRVGDARLARVFDADDRAEFPYIVTEWPVGERLGELLAAGPLDPWRAARMIADAAEAVTAAHAAGLAHLCLGPDSLWCDPQGNVQITGLGIAAALTGARAADPALADTRGLARLLYAALTGYWPGPGQTALPPAPRDGQEVRCPGQVRPGIPASICAVTCQALSGQASATAPPISGPAQLAMELAAIARPGQPAGPSRSPAAISTQPLVATAPTQPLVGSAPPAAPPNLVTVPLPPAPPLVPPLPPLASPGRPLAPPGR